MKTYHRNTDWSYYGLQQVGGVYYCAYWRYEYRVLAISQNITCQITNNSQVAFNLRDEPMFAIGYTWSHSTGWDYGRDKVISLPVTTK